MSHKKALWPNQRYSVSFFHYTAHKPSGDKKLPYSKNKIEFQYFIINDIIKVDMKRYISPPSHFNDLLNVEILLIYLFSFIVISGKKCRF